MSTERWLIGRVYCPTCDLVRAVVWTEGVTEMRCPACDTLTTAACGDEEGTGGLRATAGGVPLVRLGRDEEKLPDLKIERLRQSLNGGHAQPAPVLSLAVQEL
jgi:hypothetical protein